MLALFLEMALNKWSLHQLNTQTNKQETRNLSKSKSFININCSGDMKGKENGITLWNVGSRRNL